MATSATAVSLNVGGVPHVTFVSTLRQAPPNSFLSMLAAHLESEENSHAAGGALPVVRDAAGSVVIDRDGRLFAPILHLLRTGQWAPTLVGFGFGDDLDKLLREECDFYGVTPPALANASDDSFAKMVKDNAARHHEKDVDALGDVGQGLMQKIATGLAQRIESGATTEKDVEVFILKTDEEARPQWDSAMGPRPVQGPGGYPYGPEEQEGYLARMKELRDKLPKMETTAEERALLATSESTNILMGGLASRYALSVTCTIYTLPILVRDLDSSVPVSARRRDETSPYGRGESTIHFVVGFKVFWHPPEQH